MFGDENIKPDFIPDEIDKSCDGYGFFGDPKWYLWLCIPLWYTTIFQNYCIHEAWVQLYRVSCICIHLEVDFDRRGEPDYLLREFLLEWCSAEYV